jgi:sulfur relay (sulfurtransferase) complex TusBCD TusD component (DsrE family)
MVASIARRGQVATGGTCAAARGIEPERLVENVQSGNMDLLAEWTVSADQTLVF